MMRVTYSTQAATVVAATVVVTAVVLGVLLSDTVWEGGLMSAWFALVGSLVAFAKADFD